MSFPWKELVHDILGGMNVLDNPADIAQIPRQPQLGTLDPGTPIRMVQAQDVYAPGDRYDLSTRPGFTEVRSTAINAAGIITGMGHQGEIADRFLLTVSIAAGTHNIYDDNANPPAAIAGGTNLTVGQNNLTTLLNFTDGTNPGTIILSLLQDLPQFINSSGVRSDFTIAGTGLTSLKPAIGEIFANRALYGNCNRDGTVFGDRVYYTDIRDGNLITDHTTQFLSFERRTSDDVRGMKVLSDILLVGGRDYLSLVAKRLQGSDPFHIQDVAIGAGQGPISHQGMITCKDQRAAWMAQTGIYSLEGSQGEIVKERTRAIRPYLTGLSESRREFCSAGYDSETDIGLWAVSESGQSTNNKVIGVNFSTEEVYIWTLSRNAFAIRIVSGEQRLIGGGYVGKFYNEVRIGTFVGNADDATAAIDADIITPRHHCNLPGLRKLFLGIKVWFDQQGTSEAVTVQYRLDDESSWTSFSASPYTVAGTAGDIDVKFFELGKAGKNLQLRFRDVSSGQAYRIQKYSILYKEIDGGLV